MPEAEAIHIPLLNTNDPSSTLTELHIGNGADVAEQTLIATCESTKGVEDLHAPRSGFVCGLTAKAGDSLRAGEVLCWIADTPDWQPTDVDQPVDKRKAPEGIRITEPARKLAEKHGLALAALPPGELVTVSRLQEALASEMDIDTSLFQEAYADKAILVYGGGGHGKALIELIQAQGVYDVVGVLDDGLNPGEKVLGIPVLGGRQVLPELVSRGIGYAANAVGGIGNIQSRIDVFQLLYAAGLICPAVVHPAAFVESSAVLADGAQIFPHAYVGSDAAVGKGVIINTAAVVSHDCILGAYTNIAPGALLAGSVVTEEAVLVGMGVTINLRVTLGERAQVGNSAVIKEDVPPGGVVRAGAIWPEPGSHRRRSEVSKLS